MLKKLTRGDNAEPIRVERMAFASDSCSYWCSYYCNNYCVQPQYNFDYSWCYDSQHDYLCSVP